MVWFDLASRLVTNPDDGLFAFTPRWFSGSTTAILLWDSNQSLTEFDNPATIGSLPLGEKVLVSFFQTVSMRTAGFASLRLYSSPASDTLYLSLADVSRWSTRRDSRRDENYDLPWF